MPSISRLSSANRASSDPKDRTNYTGKFTLEKCVEIVAESLKRARIKTGRITEENRQRFLAALGTLRRKKAKRVVYKLSPTALVEMSTAERQSESCGAAEIRRGNKTVFYTPGADKYLPDEQEEFFQAVIDEDGEFTSGRVLIPNQTDFRTPTNLAIADGTPERKFIREMTNRDNSQHIDAWLKNTPVGFYSTEYAWKKGEHPKRGEFSPDFFVKKGDRIFVVEIKDDSEINDPSPENVKKHQYASEHFVRLNEWLEREGKKTQYQFNMISPKSYPGFFQKLQSNDLVDYRSELDVAMLSANGEGN
jgi:type III restriction enzyme